MPIHKSAFHLSSLVVRVGSIVVVGLFITVLDPFAVLVVSVASASSISVLKREVSVLLVIAVHKVSVKVRSSETPSVCGAVAVHLAFYAFILVLVGAFPLRVDKLGFGFLLGESKKHY